MKMMKEDLLRIREIAAEKGSELTPIQVLELLRKAKPNLVIEDEPGLITRLKTYGNNCPS